MTILIRTRMFRMTILKRPKITRPWILAKVIRPSPFGHDHSANRLRFRVGSFGFGPGHSAKVHSAMITRIRPRPFGHGSLGQSSFGHDHSDSAKYIRPWSLKFGQVHSAKSDSAQNDPRIPLGFSQFHSAEVQSDSAFH